MVISPSDLDRRLVELRHAFDRTFAAPGATVTEETIDLLGIRVAGSPYALRAREITGLTACTKLAPLPTPRGELLGVVGIRGGLVLVYSLATLLGHARDGAPIRWLALCGSTEPIAFGFPELEGFLRVPLSDVHRSDHGAVARVGDVLRSIVDIPSAIDALRARAGAARLTEER